MVFARLFPIDVTDAQDGDRTFSERTRFIGRRVLLARNDRGACLHLLCSSSPLPPSPPAEKATARQDQAGQASTHDGAGDAETVAIEFPRLGCIFWTRAGTLHQPTPTTPGS